MGEVNIADYDVVVVVDVVAVGVEMAEVED